MLDASGRIPLAATQGNRREMGIYDQCVNIFKKLDNIGEVKGKYCYGGLALPLVLLNNTATSLTVDALVNDINQDIVGDFLSNVFTRKSSHILFERRITRDQEEIDPTSLDVFLITVCIPSACSPSDLFDILGVDDLCQTKDQNKFLDAGDVACLYVMISSPLNCN